MKDPKMFEVFTAAILGLNLQLEAAYMMVEQATIPNERATYMRQVLLIEKALENAKIRRSAFE